MDFDITNSLTEGITPFYQYMSTSISMKEEADTSFKPNVKRFYFMQEHPDNPYTISDGESIYCSVDSNSFRELFQALGLKNSVDVNETIITSKFSAQDMLNALASIERRVSIDEILKDL